MLPMVTAFVPSNQNSLLSPPVLRQNNFDQATHLQMAFDNDQPSNMFDGPLPLVKERDACGVGFIANTKTGGTLINLCLALLAANFVRLILVFMLAWLINHYR